MSRFKKLIGGLIVGIGLLVMSSVASHAAVATQPTGAAVSSKASGLLQFNAGAGHTDEAQQGHVRLAQRRRRGGFRRRGAGRRGGFRRRGFRRRGFRGRRYRRRRRRGRWVGPAIGAGIAAIIIGGAIEASRRNYRDRWLMCDDEFVSFRWSDGTYQPYGGGPRELCPYLRGE